MSEVESDQNLGSGPGALLAQKREQCGLSPQQAAERLNLDATAIMAIERDQFESLGAPVFVKGHLRHYAALVGLHENDLIRSYEHSQAGPAQPTLVPKTREDLPSGSGGSRRYWVVGSLLLFLIAVAVTAYLSEYRPQLPQEGARGSVPPPEIGEATTSRSDALEFENTTLARAEPGSSSASGERPAAAESSHDTQSVATDLAERKTNARTPAAGQVKLVLEFATDSWVEIYDQSGQAVFYNLGEAGTERAIVAAAPLSVTVGNADAVGLLINGVRVNVPEPGPGQTVARFSVGPDGSLH